jgi:hypothetical protein
LRIETSNGNANVHEDSFLLSGYGNFVVQYEGAVWRGLKYVLGETIASVFRGKSGLRPYSIEIILF